MIPIGLGRRVFLAASCRDPTFLDEEPFKLENANVHLSADAETDHVTHPDLRALPAVLLQLRARMVAVGSVPARPFGPGTAENGVEGSEDIKKDSFLVLS